MEIILAFGSGLLVGGVAVGYEVRQRWLRDRRHLKRTISDVKNDLKLEEDLSTAVTGHLMNRIARLLYENRAAHADLHAAKSGRLQALKEVAAP